MWRPADIGEVIAERELTFRRPDREPSSVIVRFGKPVQEPKPDDSAPWWCPIEVRGLGADRASSIAGEDSLQALVLALEFVTKDLPSQAQKLGGELDWLDEREHLVFASTFMLELYLAAINRLTAGLQDTLQLLERTELVRAPEHASLLKRLRDLIQTQGFSGRSSGSHEAG